MKNLNEEQKISNVESKLYLARKIIDNLSGQFNNDKETLISNIKKLRNKKEDNSAAIVMLGTKLYQLLIENGLNESDHINYSRLMDKVDGLVYNEKYEMALDLLEVLDAVEPFSKVDDMGKPIYNVGNMIEAEIILQRFNPKKRELTFNYTARNACLIKKASVLERMGKTQDALAVVKEILENNPASFQALLYKARLTKDAGLEKFKKQVLEAYEVAFMPSQMVEYLEAMCEYYFDKQDFYGASCALLASTLYIDPSYLEPWVKKIEKEANKHAIKLFEFPKSDDIKRFLEREQIPRMLKEINQKIVCGCYLKAKLEGNDEEFLIFCKNLLKEIYGDDSMIKELDKIYRQENKKGE